MNELVTLFAGHEDSVETRRLHEHLPCVDSIECEEIELLSRLLLGAMLRDMRALRDVGDPLEDLDSILAVQGSYRMAVEPFLLVPSVTQDVESPLQQSSRALRLNGRSARLQDACERQQQRV